MAAAGESRPWLNVKKREITRRGDGGAGGRGMGEGGAKLEAISVEDFCCA